MVRLFLSSVACNVLDQFIALLDRPPQELTVGFIPTAADVYENKWFVDNDRNKLLQSGFRIKELNIAGESEAHLQELMEDIDIIFVAGGNVFYLLEQMQRSGCDAIIKRLVENNIWYVGSSAGAVIAGLSIQPVRLMDEPILLDSYNGLQLINNNILPHDGNKKYQETIDQIKREYPDIIALTDTQAVIVDENRMRIISAP